MVCCQCEGIEQEFGVERATRKLNAYRQNGLATTSQWLVNAILQQGIEGMTVLDIGGGIGGIQHALLSAGAAGAVHVDASSAYIQAAQVEAARRGFSDRIEHVHGDFVMAIARIAPADIVTLDRVICCYHDMPRLLAASLDRTRHIVGLVFPRPGWWIRVGSALGNCYYSLKKSAFRMYAHSPDQVDDIIRQHGLRKLWCQRDLVWQASLYRRID